MIDLELQHQHLHYSRLEPIFAVTRLTSKKFNQIHVDIINDIVALIQRLSVNGTLTMDKTHLFCDSFFWSLYFRLFFYCCGREWRLLLLLLRLLLTCSHCCFLLNTFHSVHHGIYCAVKDNIPLILIGRALCIITHCQRVLSPNQTSNFIA